MISAKNFTQEQISKINRVNIINMIRREQQTTKQAIAKALKLSIPTVTTNINILLNEGLVKEVGIAESTGGRKPIIIGFEKDSRFSFGVSITPYHVLIRLINLENEVLFDKSYDYSDMDSALDLVAEVMGEVIVELKIEKKNILGVGLALPGICDDKNLILVKAPNLGIKKYSFKDFSKKTGLKVWIENEANVAAFAEHKVGNAASIGNLVYVSITEGIGAGIIIKHHIYKSNQKSAGEFGHTRVTEDIRKCNCGRTGCWELFASKLALIRYYEELSQEAGANEERIFALYDAGDKSAVQAIEKYIKYLFYGIENIIIGLNPDYIIIGGEFGKYSTQLKNAITLVGMGDAENLEYEGSKIIFSDLQDKGSLIGAALLPQEELFNYSENVI